MHFSSCVGVPLTKQALCSDTLDEHLDSKSEFPTNVLQSKNYPNTFHKCTSRVLKQLGYVDRKKTTSQKTPVNWDNIAREGAANVRKFFKDNKVEVVLAGDEFFQQHHGEHSKVLVPRGTKRVGAATKLGNTKEGCTVMVTMVLEGSRLLMPTIVFNGNYLFYIALLLFITNYIILRCVWRNSYETMEHLQRGSITIHRKPLCD